MYSGMVSPHDNQITATSSVNEDEPKLALQLLQKLFAEFSRSHMSSQEYQSRLLKMIPLFYKIIENNSSNLSLATQFKEAAQFSNHLAMYFVQEVRRRASNQSNEAAAQAVASWLESEDGTMLLRALNALASCQGDALAQAALPSTLAKSIYLFYDLPVLLSPDAQGRRETMADDFTALLVTLCAQKMCSDELVKRDDLRLLFNALCGMAPLHNCSWRCKLAKVLSVLQLTPLVTKFLHDKHCISLCVESIRAADLPLEDQLQALNAVLALIKRSIESPAAQKLSTLVDDWRHSGGFKLIGDLALRQLEPEHCRHFLALAWSACGLGVERLVPSPSLLSSSLLHLPGFRLPEPSYDSAVSVRNPDAYLVLQRVFIESGDDRIHQAALDLITLIFNADAANYFILYPLRPLSALAECLSNRSERVCVKYFELFEYVIYDLNYIPCEELFSISVLLKTPGLNECCLSICLRSLTRMFARDARSMRDIFRNVGILDALVSLLNSSNASSTLLAIDLITLLINNCLENANVFRKAGGPAAVKQLIESVDSASLPSSSGSNPIDDSTVANENNNRLQGGLAIMQQLCVLPNSDDDLAIMLELAQSGLPSRPSVGLRKQVLRSLLAAVRESHRVRLAFRKQHGYLYLMSSLVALEGALSSPLRHSSSESSSSWSAEPPSAILDLIGLVLKLLTLSMRFEPANASYFAQEVGYDALTSSIKLLGCFGSMKEIPAYDCLLSENNTTESRQSKNNNNAIGSISQTSSIDANNCIAGQCSTVMSMSTETADVSAASSSLTFDSPRSRRLIDEFKAIFSVDKLHHSSSPNRSSAQLQPDMNESPLPAQLCYACHIARYLFDMCLDGWDKPYLTTSGEPDINQQQQNAVGLDHSELMVVHPGALLAFVKLLPAIDAATGAAATAAVENAAAVWALRQCLAEQVKMVLKWERNQQIMAEAGLPKVLFDLGARNVFPTKSHPLLPVLSYMLERMATQYMSPADLRRFLRMDQPLCCRDLDADKDEETCVGSESVPAGPIPLSRVKTLVSMLSSRPFHTTSGAQLHCAGPAPFIEFDMSVEGFGSLFLPSIAPQQPPEQHPSAGGLGSGPERVFPPVNGLTFLSWLWIEKWSNPLEDPHPLRLLTIVRHLPLVVVSGTTDKGGGTNSSGGKQPQIQQQYDLACLTVQISPVDRALIISTNETDTPGADLDKDVGVPECVYRIHIPELRQEQQWMQLGICLQRQVLKTSQLLIYFNGKLYTSQKLPYVITCPGGPYNQISTLQAVQSISAMIGTPPGPFRRQSRLRWRLGPAWLLEDAAGIQPIVEASWKLGPAYIGCFQNVDASESSCPTRLTLVSEEKVVFGLHCQAESKMTLARMRRLYNKTDTRSIGRQLGLSSHENLTPIRVLHNSAAHFSGPGRSLGAVLVGYLGMRVFRPRPTARLLESLGGSEILLGLVAMANNTEAVYAAVKALVCALSANPSLHLEMSRSGRGWRTLSALLHQKQLCLNAHTLHLLFSLAGTLDATDAQPKIVDVQAFEELLLDLDLWSTAPSELIRLLCEHLFEILAVEDHQQNLLTARKLNIAARLLRLLSVAPVSALPAVLQLLTAVLQPPAHAPTLLAFGQFIIGTLPASSASSCNDQSAAAAAAVVYMKSTEVDERSMPEHTAQLLSNSCDQQQLLTELARAVFIRNRSLAVLLTVLTTLSGNLQLHYCELLCKTLGFDWLFALLHPGLHSDTVALSLCLLQQLLRHSSLNLAFKSGNLCGGWLQGSDSVVQGRAGTLLGFSVSAHGGSIGSACDINPEICRLPGPYALSLLLPSYFELNRVWFWVCSYLTGQQQQLSTSTGNFVLSLDVDDDVENNFNHVEFTLDSVWSKVFHLPPQHSVTEAVHRTQVSTEATPVLLSLVRRALSTTTGSENGGTKTVLFKHQNSVTALQLLLFLYHSVADMTLYCMSEEFVLALLSTLFPVDDDAAGVEDHSKLTDVDVVNGDNSDYAAIIAADVAAVEQQQQRCAHLQACRRQIIDFLRSILIDSLTVVRPSGGDSSASPLDAICEAQIEGIDLMSVQRVVAQILQNCMDQLIAADILLDGPSPSTLNTNVTQNTSYNHVANNVMVMVARSVDLLNTGGFCDNELLLFDVVVKLVGQAKRRAASGFSADSLHHSLNRCITYLLSRDSEPLLISTLQRIKAQRSLIFGASNSVDLDFFPSLAHLLFEIVAKEPSKPVLEQVDKVWEELYLAKKQVLEDSLSVTLVPEIRPARSIAGAAAQRVFCSESSRTSSSSALYLLGSQTPQIQLQARFRGVADRVQRLASRKSFKRDSNDAAFCGGDQDNQQLISKQTLHLWMRVHQSLVRELWRQKRMEAAKNAEHAKKEAMEYWRFIELSLTRQRGLWGPEHGSKLEMFQLDSTEGPSRMRKKLVPDFSFYIRYPFRPVLDLPESKNLRYKVAISKHSRQYYDRIRLRWPRAFDSRIIDQSSVINTPSSEQLLGPAVTVSSTTAGCTSDEDTLDFVSVMLRRASQPAPYPASATAAAEYPHEPNESIMMNDDDEIVTSSSVDNCDDNSADNRQETSSTASESVSSSTQLTVSSEGVEIGGKEAQSLSSKSLPPGSSVAATASKVGGPDNQLLLKLIDESDELQSMFRCARVSGLDTQEGLLLFGREHYYFVEGYTLLKTREIRDLDYLPEELHDPIVPYMATGGLPSCVANKRLKQHQPARQCHKFAYDEVREVHRRRYLLQPIALEIFSSDGRNHLLAFPRRTRDKVYLKLAAVARVGVERPATESVSGQKHSVDVERQETVFDRLLAPDSQSVTVRWLRGELSNFQYLMYLNTLAGRSYNDLMQYPVFPWVLCDYESEELDLTNPCAFRDFSKPMGAQTAQRLAQFMKRYREWDDPTGETPPYMYSTHYSSAMFVVSYLVRLEPFTHQFLKLQGGHFDLADRMFHSVRDAWLSASQNNMADVKELIPEFFYLPDFLVNSNRFDMGVKQSGVALDDIILPVWAKNDPLEFIRLHRAALECDHVSQHLHLWIDLIFGFRQQGPAAEEAYNLFHHEFYEANADIDSIDDPVKRQAKIGIINNFGQIPKQLFKKPHPAKKLAQVEWPLAMPGVTTERLFYHCLDFLRPPMSPIKELRGPVGQIVQNDKGVWCAVEPNKVLLPPNFARFISYGFADASIRIGNLSDSNEKSSCLAEIPGGADVTCASCPTGRLLVTGSLSSLVQVWELTKTPSKPSTLVGSSGGGGSGGGGQYQLKLRGSLHGHSTPVICIASSGQYQLILSGDQEGLSILWDLSTLNILRVIGPHPSAITAVAINQQTGDLATAAGTHVFIWDINGRPLAQANTSATPQTRQTVLCVAFSELYSWDPLNVVLTGGSDGVVRCWTLDWVQVLEESAAKEQQEVELGFSSPNALSVDPCELRLRLLERFDSEPGSPAPGSDHGDMSFNSGTPQSVHSASRDESDSPPPTAAILSKKQGSIDSFVFVDNDGVVAVRSSGSGRLRPGHKWTRQLVFRSKFSMHTAYDRKDNFSPAAITALGIARDHKALVIGDARGRLWLWACPPLSGGGGVASSGGGQQSGGPRDHWVQDTARQQCTQCQQRFSFSERRHHCRNCGQLFCNRCSRFESDIKHMKISRPVRVCQQCYLKLKQPSTSTPTAPQ